MPNKLNNFSKMILADEINDNLACGLGSKEEIGQRSKIHGPQVHDSTQATTGGVQL